MADMLMREPLDDFMDWPRALRRIMEDFPLHGPWRLEEGAMPVDLYQEDGEVVVRALIPGFTKEEIEVQVENGMVSIKAQRVHEEETKKRRYYRREVRAAALSRRVSLPGVVREEKAKAELRDGVLILRIPIAEGAKPKQIPIHTG